MSKLPSLSAIGANPLAQRAAGKLREGHKAVTSRAIEAALKGSRQGRLSLPRKLASLVLMRVATRSVPGAIVVGGALLAKHLHDKKKAHDAAKRDSTAESRLLTPEPADKKPAKA
ncbi:MAG: hypothetical protein KGJ57_09075 [Sphingomonadales bacterium]|nr:hypothetical protein [Sphingomonadales bacterium]MDE2169563.1 hypothetical protein [Sphingomonadales bacterium]